MDEQIIMQEEVVEATNEGVESTETKTGLGKKLAVGGLIAGGAALGVVVLVKTGRALKKHVIQPVGAKIKSLFTKNKQVEGDPEWDEACETMDAIKREKEDVE